MKKLNWIIPLIFVFSLTACSGEREETTVPTEIIPEEIVVEVAPEEEVSLEPEEEMEEILENSTAPTVTMATIEGEAEYRGYSLTYDLELPVFENFPEDSAGILESYYQSVGSKYVSYLENEVVYQLETMAWDGDFDYHMDCEVTYLSETLVSFLRTAEEPNQEPYYNSETFSVENGGLVTLDYLFGLEEAEYRQVILDFVLESIANDDELLPQLSQRESDWKTTVSNQLDLDQFFITEDGLSVYFQHNQLGLGFGFSTIIPWENLPDTVK